MNARRLKQLTPYLLLLPSIIFLFIFFAFPMVSAFTLAFRVGGYLAAACPPNLPSIRHVVINSLQAQQVASRYGLTSRVIPNVMDFDSPPPAPDSYPKPSARTLELTQANIFFLQPTRVIQRKGIEHAVELVRRLELPAKLVISHASGDEGTDYEQRVARIRSFVERDRSF